jgi:hypothetical protein
VNLPNLPMDNATTDSEGENAMRNTILAAATAFALMVGTAASFANSSPPQQGGAIGTQGGVTATQSNSRSSNLGQDCAEVLAHPSGHPASAVEYCRSQ